MSRPSAEFVLKGAITRLALYFYGRSDEKFTGFEVSRILLEAWHGYEQSKLPGNIAIADATGFVESPDSHLGALEGV